MDTKAKVIFGMYDVTAKGDNTVTAPDKQPFIRLEELNEDELTVKKWATLEHNLFVLDGSFELFPDDPESESFGLWSQSMSDENGDFSVPPTLTIEFGSLHKSIGIQFRFSETTGDYCPDLTIAWYDSSNTLIDTKDYQPDGTDYLCENSVSNYKKLVITFRKTSAPYRYLKVTEIVYGFVETLQTGKLIDASVFEEIDPISDTLSINTANLSVFSETDEFNPLVPNGKYFYLQQRQPLDFYATVDGVEKYMGRYYMETWQSDMDCKSEFDAIDIIGVIDKTDFMGGIYTNKTVQSLVDEIMQSAGVEEYEVETKIQSITLTGYIPICTHREALQYVAFAAGAVVDCSRSRSIKIYTLKNTVDNEVGASRRITGQKISVDASLITGVEVTAYSYSAGESREVFKETKTVGKHTVTFSTPASGLTVRGATIVESGVNYAVIDVTTAGEVTITGTEYVENTSVFGTYMSELPAAQLKNVVSYDGCTLISPENALSVSQRLFNYFQNIFENDFSFRAGTEMVGQKIKAVNGNANLVSTILSMNIDLTGGFIAKVKTQGTVGT